MDEKLGKILDQLKTLGLDNNTLVVFMGDHGYHMGDKNYYNKTTLFDRSCKAPLIMSHPIHIPQNSTVDHVIEFIDIYPTITDLCGLDTPSMVEGRSMKSLLQQKKVPWREVAYSYVNRSRTVVGDRFRYARWHESKQEALYDLKNDPEEHYNLIDKPEYASILNKMRVLVDEMPEYSK